MVFSAGKAQRPPLFVRKAQQLPLSRENPTALSIGQRPNGSLYWQKVQQLLLLVKGPTPISIGGKHNGSLGALSVLEKDTSKTTFSFLQGGGSGGGGVVSRWGAAVVRSFSRKQRRQKGLSARVLRRTRFRLF